MTSRIRQLMVPVNNEAKRQYQQQNTQKPKEYLRKNSISNIKNIL